jgi:hypothetical protein
MISMGEEQLKSIFQQIASRLESRRDSLSEIKKLENSSNGSKGMGIEGWLQVEAVKALGEKIKKVQNRGPDLIIDDNGKKFDIELKGMSNFSVTDNSFKAHQADTYLFLCDFDGNQEKKLERLKNIKKWKLIDYRKFNDGVGDWILFMMKFKS